MKEPCSGSAVRICLLKFKRKRRSHSGSMPFRGCSEREKNTTKPSFAPLKGRLRGLRLPCAENLPIFYRLGHGVKSYASNVFVIQNQCSINTNDTKAPVSNCAGQSFLEKAPVREFA
jgi:hypothetical protein